MSKPRLWFIFNFAYSLDIQSNIINLKVKVYSDKQTQNNVRNSMSRKSVALLT